MDAAQSICILWDASHIWGLMAWRAVRALGLPCRLVKASDIAEGALLGKPGAKGQKSPLLLVPGGNARRKSLALGAAGRKAVRDYVASGGRYLGFCGGAGLALTHADAEDGLNICPWGRAVPAERLQHLISGHVRAHVPARTPAGKVLSLPVWWPGRFEPKGDDVRVLAVCDAPDNDFWIADLPLQRIPAHVFAAWQEVYGVDLSADFLTGEPLVISGDFGKGRYVLSYSHLETPQSADANRWLGHLLCELTGHAPKTAIVPAWDLRKPGLGGVCAPLAEAVQKSHALLRLAVEHYLFFERAPWFWGWRAGLPGAVCNHLHAALCTAAALASAPPACRKDDQQRFLELSFLFFSGAEKYLLACRLAGALASTLPGVVDNQELAGQRDAYFGHPMHGGGIVEELLTILEEFLYLSQTGEGNVS
ncbi:MAG: hypothetical protein LBB60_04460 [Desulfovibrio sp.]|jgi:hypothetical protein|nr:hypothetical protein [Desulfovibrio sp.]